MLGKLIKVGNVTENKVTSIILGFPSELDGFSKFIEFETDDGPVYDALFDNTYILKNNITKYESVIAQIVFKDLVNNKTWKSDTFTIDFGKSINAEYVIDDEETSHTVIETIVSEITEINANIADLENNKLNKTGDAKDNVVTFNEAITRSNISSGEKLSILLGKIKKFFTDLKNVAFTGSYNDLADRPEKLSDFEDDLGDEATHTHNQYVEKVEGKDLSSNDFSDEYQQDVTDNTESRHEHSNKEILDEIEESYKITEKEKLNDIEANAQVNILEEIKVNNQKINPVNKTVNISIPTSYGYSLVYNSSTGVIDLKDNNNKILSSVDLPLELIVQSGIYNSTTKKIELTLANGDVIYIDAADLVDEYVADNNTLQLTLVNGKNTFALSATYKSKIDNALAKDGDAKDNTVTFAEASQRNNIGTGEKISIMFGKIKKFFTDLKAVAFSGSYNDLADAPTNVSSFTNDSGYITEHQDISGKEDNSNKVTSISGVSTNTEYPSAKCVYDAISNINSNRGHVYGIKRKISNNSSSMWERTDDAIGLTANAKRGTSEVQNDFDNLSPWKEIISFNLELTTGKKKAYYGDADFKFDGSNGDVYTHIPTFWIKIWQENDYEYISIADYAKSGYKEIKEFDIARYKSGIDNDGLLHSYSGLVSARSKTIGQYRTLAKSLGDDYCLLDWRYFAIQYLYLVEYADYNSQLKLGNGMTTMRYNNGDVSLIAENNTNRFIVNTAGGNSFYVGQIISIGTSGLENFTVADSRKVTAINEYSEGDITGKEIIFDGEPVNIVLTNVIWSSPQASGGCDSLGMQSGCLINDSKHDIIYRGIETIFGNIYTWIDGINIKDRVAYICYNPVQYESDKFDAPYEALGYTNVATNGYIKKIGFDINNPLARFPVETGGGSTSYMSDYYYQDAGNRVARVGGSLSCGAGAGLWYWYLSGSSSGAYWGCGARVLKHQ